MFEHFTFQKKKADHFTFACVHLWRSNSRTRHCSSILYVPIVLIIKLNIFAALLICSRSYCNFGLNIKLFYIRKVQENFFVSSNRSFFKSQVEFESNTKYFYNILYRVSYELFATYVIFPSFIVNFVPIERCFVDAWN